MTWNRIRGNGMHAVLGMQRGFVSWFRVVVQRSGPAGVAIGPLETV